MHSLFELTEAKKLSSWLIGISILLFVFFITIHFLSMYDIRLFDSGSAQLLIASGWYRTQPILIFGLLILGTILLVVGISLWVLCNNISRLLKSYDEEMIKKMSRGQ